jgi:hypothetical protein
MKMFGNLSTEGLEEVTDRIGGGGPMDTGVYTGKVTLAYLKHSGSSEAQALAVHIDFGGREYREDFWVVNRNGENFYQDKQDAKKKHPLPGFVTADDLCLLTSEMGLADQDAEDKVVKLYDYDAKKEMPTQVKAFTSLHGKEITAAIVRQTVDKNTKTDDGRYVPSGETRDENVVEKFFHTESKLTVVEAKAGLDEGTFHDKWKTKNEGSKPRDRSSNKAGAAGSPGRSGAPGAPSTGAKSSGLFGKK